MALPCPLLALSGHPSLHRTCPLSGVKRTSRVKAANFSGFHSQTNSVAAIRFANAVLDCVVRRAPTTPSDRVIQFSPAVSVMPDDGSTICISPPLVISGHRSTDRDTGHRNQDDHNNIVQRRSPQSPIETHLPTVPIRASSSCPPFIKRAASAGRYAALPSSARKSLRTT